MADNTESWRFNKMNKTPNYVDYLELLSLDVVIRTGKSKYPTCGSPIHATIHEGMQGLE